MNIYIKLEQLFGGRVSFQVGRKPDVCVCRTVFVVLFVAFSAYKKKWRQEFATKHGCTFYFVGNIEEGCFFCLEDMLYGRKLHIYPGMSGTEIGILQALKVQIYIGESGTKFQKCPWQAFAIWVDV